MKKSILILLLNLSFLSTHFAQTEIYGGIFEATIWTAANSPYIVTDDIVIFPAGNLTIEPGVEVRFYPGKDLEIRANFLHANGTAEQPIIFTSTVENPVPLDRWRGIRVTSTLSDSVGLELNHVKIKNADKGVDFTFSEGMGHRTFSNITFEKNGYGVFSFEQNGNSVDIINGEFINNYSGIAGTVSIFNTLFFYNFTCFLTPQISEITGKGGEIIDCTFLNNGGVVTTVAPPTSFHIHVENSDFINNSHGIWSPEAYIDNCYFSNMFDSAIEFGKGEVKNCVFSENGSAIRTGLWTDSVSIHHNYFSNDSIALRIGLSEMKFYENTICNATQYAAVITTDQPVDLNNNCWCTTDLDEIAAAIYDGNDDPTLGIASYEMLNPDCSVSSVFPGDANNDGFANVWDILPIGLAFNETGPVRPDAETIWTGQIAEDWPITLANNVNIKHADCDGDGSIGFADRSVIETNYAKFHTSPTTFDPIVNHDNTYQLYLDLPDVLTIGETVQVDVLLTDENNPIIDLYGIAFAIEGDEPFFEPNSFQLITTGSWLGDESNLLEISRDFPYDGRIEIGLVRNDQQAASGYGLIARLEFVMSEDIIAAYFANGGNHGTILSPGELLLNAIKIEAMDSEGIYLSIENVEQEIIINHSHEIDQEIAETILIAPNPASEFIYLNYQNLPIEEVTLFDISGKMLEQFPQAAKKISVKNLDSGIYFLKFQTATGVGMKKFVVGRED